MRGTTAEQLFGAKTGEQFQSTCPLRGTTGAKDQKVLGYRDFNPRAPCGARQARGIPRTPKSAFQSTCPLRGTTQNFQGDPQKEVISIHVPLAGHDDCAGGYGMRTQISIHVPLAGHDIQNLPTIIVEIVFQSTCPLRGTTGRCFREGYHTMISIHVPLAGHDGLVLFAKAAFCISIHVPLAGHDCRDLFAKGCFCISIHVPLAGHDAPGVLRRADATQFQSTCPLRGTTDITHGGSTMQLNFNPRAPCGARQLTEAVRPRQGDFNPRAPCGARLRCPACGTIKPDFNPRAPCGARLQKGTKITVHFCENRLDLRFSANSAACQEQNRS